MKNITLENIQITLDGITNTLSDFKNDVNKRLDNIEKIEGEHGKRLDNIEHTVAKIEFEHGNQLKAISDSMKVNDQKHFKYDEDIEKINSTIFNHGIRIEALEEKAI